MIAVARVVFAIDVRVSFGVACCVLVLPELRLFRVKAICEGG